MKIIFDFDNTLFHEQPFVERIRAYFQMCGVLPELYDATRKEAYDREVWRQFRHMELLAARSGVLLAHLERKLEETIDEASAFLYPDVLGFLHQAHSEYPLNILTFGDAEFQRMKMEGAGVGTFMENVVVTEDIMKAKDAAVLAGGKPALFVDDNPAALEATKTHAPYITTVRMNRGDGKYASTASGSMIDYEIRNLEELYKLL